MFGKPFGVLGAGPVGSIVAAHLCKTGHKVYIIDASSARLDQIRTSGITVGGVTTVPTQHPVLLGSVKELAGVELAALFICTKTWALRTLLPDLAASLDRNAVVVSFQNGIGPEEEIAAHIDRARVCRGIVNFAGSVGQDGGEVPMHWFNPPNYLGALDGARTPVQQLADVLDATGLATSVVSPHEIKKQVFYKTILNSALNALCASSGITMRQAMVMRHTRSLAQLLIREGLSVASALGYYYGESSMADCIKYLDRGGDHLPSMWVDLQRGLPTEIEYINGKIVQVGKMFRNVDVDVNAFFTSMIVTLEIKSGVRKPEDIPEYLTVA